MYIFIYNLYINEAELKLHATYIDHIMVLSLCSDCPDYDGGSQVTEYAVMATNPDQTSREVYRGHDTECVVAGLLPGRTYTFEVKAFNKTGVMTVYVRDLRCHCLP